MEDRAFSFSTISQICNDLVGNMGNIIYLDNIILGCKLLAISFIILNFINRFLGYKRDDKTHNELSTPPVTVSYILTQFGFILLTFYFGTLMSFLDNILSGFYQEIENNINGDPNSLYNALNTALLTTFESDEVVNNDDTLYQIVLLLDNLFNPLFWLTSLAQWIGWLVNTFTVAFYLIERGMMLIILNIMAPFVIALSVLEQFREYFIKFIKLYIATYLISAIIVIVNSVTSIFYLELANVLNTFGMVQDDMLIVILVVILVKARLYSAGINLLNKMFGT